jgi:hypothetical protein
MVTPVWPQNCWRDLGDRDRLGNRDLTADVTVGTVSTETGGAAAGQVARHPAAALLVRAARPAITTTRQSPIADNPELRSSTAA